MTFMALLLNKTADGQVMAARSGELTVYKVSRPTKFRAAYLFFRFSMRALPAARINTLFALQDITVREFFLSKERESEFFYVDPDYFRQCFSMYPSIPYSAMAITHRIRMDMRTVVSLKVWLE